MTERCPTCGNPLRSPQVSVCLNTNTVIVAGQSIKLSLTHAEILYCLARCSPQPLAHERLYLQVYGYNVPEGVRAIMQVNMCMLRRKLRPVGFNIEIVRGIGYALRPLDPAEGIAA